MTPTTWLRAKGQLTLPAEVREAARLEEGDPVEVEMVPEGILLRPKKMIDSTQAWFWEPAWQAGERETSTQIAAEDVRRYGSGEELVEALKARSKPVAKRSRPAKQSPGRRRKRNADI